MALANTGIKVVIALLNKQLGAVASHPSSVAELDGNFKGGQKIFKKIICINFLLSKLTYISNLEISIKI